MIEYKLISLAKTPELVNTELNDLSEDGWRVVCSCGKNNRCLVLKRKVKEYEEEE